jgi:tetratricopeptide repeat protein 21B
LQSPRHAVLEAYCLIASKNRANVEQAIQHLGAILSDNPNDVRALLALSTALMVLKQTPKARNQLKRLAKMPFNSELADQFVQSYLLLADVYISCACLPTDALSRPRDPPPAHSRT